MSMTAVFEIFQRKAVWAFSKLSLAVGPRPAIFSLVLTLFGMWFLATRHLLSPQIPPPRDSDLWPTEVEIEVRAPKDSPRSGGVRVSLHTCSVSHPASDSCGEFSGVYVLVSADSFPLQTLESGPFWLMRVTPARGGWFWFYGPAEGVSADSSLDIVQISARESFRWLSSKGVDVPVTTQEDLFARVSKWGTQGVGAAPLEAAFKWLRIWSGAIQSMTLMAFSLLLSLLCVRIWFLSWQTRARADLEVASKKQLASFQTTLGSWKDEGDALGARSLYIFQIQLALSEQKRRQDAKQGSLPDPAALDFIYDSSDSAYERLEAFDQIPRMLLWLIPTLGFLGTVVGISGAMANTGALSALSPVDQAQARLAVSAALGVAFDTTFVSLVLSAVGTVIHYSLSRAEFLSIADTKEAVLETVSEGLAQRVLAATSAEEEKSGS